MNVQVFTVPLVERRYKEMNEHRFGDESDQAKICKDIMQKHGVAIEISLARDQSMTVVINGRSDNVMKARREVVSKLQTQVKAPHIGWSLKVVSCVESDLCLKVCFQGSNLSLHHARDCCQIQLYANLYLSTDLFSRTWIFDFYNPIVSVLFLLTLFPELSYFTVRWSVVFHQLTDL